MCIRDSTSDYDPKNALDIEKFLNRKEKIHPDDTFIMVDACLLYTSITLFGKCWDMNLLF